MSSQNGYGRTGWIAAIILSVVVTFVGTLLFAQSVWMYTPNAGTAGTAAMATSQPATNPAPQSGSDAATPPNTGKIDGIGDYDGTDDVDHSAFNDVLADNVRNERLDYAAIKDGSDFAKLKGYLDAMAKVDVESLSDAERLAYWINLYNASMIEAVLGQYPIDNVQEDLPGVFDKKFIDARQGVMSLNDIEHETIRKQWNEPRVHSALVCGAVSCPPLLPRAYRAEDLDATLDKKVRQWIDSPRNEIDDDGKTLRLSSIFKWYGDDFGDVPTFVNQYTDQDVSGYKVEFLDYDWTLNDTKGE